MNEGILMGQTMQIESERAERIETLLQDIERHLAGMHLVMMGLDPQGISFHVHACAAAVTALRAEIGDSRCV
jgi:hypothetical protein